MDATNERFRNSRFIKTTYFSASNIEDWGVPYKYVVIFIKFGKNRRFTSFGSVIKAKIALSAFITLIYAMKLINLVA